MPRLRLGVALLVPPPAAIEVDGLRRACGDDAIGRIPAHLTIVPPVNVNVVELPEALAVLRRAAAAVAGPINVQLGPVTTFAPATPVLYLGVDGEVDAIQRLRDAVFVPPLARRLTWPFVPHVTLADDIADERIAAATAALADFRRQVTFTAVTLLREGPPGRTWSPFADARLGPPAVIGRGGLPVELWRSSMPDPEMAPILEGRSPVPESAEPWVITARREDVVLGAACGWRRDGEVVVDRLAVTDAAGHEDLERHLRAAAVAVS